MTYKDIIFFIKVSAEYVTSENLLLNSLWERERKRERKTEEEREYDPNEAIFRSAH